MAVNVLAAPHRQQQERDAHSRGFHHFAHPHPAQVSAHEHRDGDRRADRKDAPRAFGQRLDHHQREHRQQDDHDREDGSNPDGTRR